MTGVLEAEFDLAVQHVRTLKANLSNNDKLVLYALFKQVELGDCAAERPKRSKVVAMAKWNAWMDQKGKEKEDCMREYIEYVTSLDATFSSRAVAMRKNNSVYETGLDTLPGSSRSLRLDPEVLKKNRDSYVSRASGMNPLTGQNDDSSRMELYERIRRFYEKHNLSKLNHGIGDIVDWTLENGEDALNENLRNKYDEDLTTLDKKVAEEQAEREKQVAEAQRRVATAAEGEEGEGEGEEEEASLEDQLTKFFLRYDPDRAGQDYSVLVRYHAKRGIYALNAKLYEKYGASLQELHVTSPKQTVFSDSKEEDLAKVEIDELLEYSVDEDLMELLISYYAKYDPERLENGSVDLIYRWTQRNGTDKLNARLKKKYNESLEEFANVAGSLQDEVIAFYGRVDKHKLVSGVDHIINWGLKNGRAALNQKLRAKYGSDLDDGGGLDDVDF